ncbi:MAG: alpha/beta hydrolase [Flavobacteriia bacterium]|nr:alpha/beta hydrolase [Flavobacteriia bacterium]OIP46752.1 MAG: alpha/beta hydrolase [Flavobacteriaceae bacterium CG2_30_31_66]PIV95809.1 MAG: alpha/beta hydrolase [Flavobacteriaceae bacterium CG17_big_fil_post_rev_8_21_14_2_50_31_13]PIX14829.1 MAG: alpha/beta hydrolase [Flavobacteriaceae bacterium CG_4_8_14_3_um_filter_31_8]PIY16121.1 MAG: alpha/beta hydrolase [Flavobacteriaceae bacterium CG_4_10_14_3_um_filter_31_253]PIZ11325.1 MAG: alpha/beta hydrolase [Flavobacteriaceae bacterium CG_4_10
MNFSTDTFKTPDKQTIFYYKWFANKNMPLRGVVQISHGVGEHAGRYHSIAQVLQNEGYEVYANDHRIHGKSVRNEDFLGYYDGEDYFSDALNDMRQLSEIIKKEHPSKKIILFGHSMGSFLSRAYASKYGGDLEALILSGTASFMKGLGGFGIFSAKLLSKINGKHRSNEMLKNIFFSNFNKHFKPNRTQSDWLSSDENQVDLFEADPLRIEDFSLSIYVDILTASKKVNEEIIFKNTPKELPIYVFSGGQDPVGEMGKGVKKVAENFKKAGIQNLTLKIYEFGRHEMLNEINKTEVENDLLTWLHQQTKAQK